jgi:hypothetical protein
VARLPEGPRDDPGALARATALLASAEELARQEKWTEAKAALQSLLLEHEPLTWTRQRAARIGELTGLCDSKLSAIASRRQRTIDQARLAAGEGKWEEARRLWTEAVQEGLTEFRKDLDLAQREIEAEKGVAGFREAFAAGRWSEAVARGADLGNRLAETSTILKQLEELKALAARALEETKTGELLSEARAAAVAGRWPEVKARLGELESKAQTATYRQRQAEIAALRADFDRAALKEIEEAAQRGWTAAQAQYQDLVAARKYDDACEALRAFQRDHVVSALAGSKKAEIEARIADAGRRKAKDRDDEARRIWQGIQKDVAAKPPDHEGAHAGLLQLLSEFAETPFVRANERQLKQLKSTCDERLGLGEHVLARLEFEDTPGKWSGQGGAVGSNELGGFQGKRAARLVLYPGSYGVHPVESGVPPKAEAVVFHVRSVKKGNVSMTFSLLEEAGTWSAQVPVTGDWKAQSVRLSALTFSSAAGQSGRPPFDPSRISAFTVGVDVSEGQYEILLDSLRFEAARK